MLHSILLVLGVVCNTTRPIAEMCTRLVVKVQQIQPASAGVAAQKQQQFGNGHWQWHPTDFVGTWCLGS